MLNEGYFIGNLASYPDTPSAFQCFCVNGSRGYCKTWTLNSGLWTLDSALDWTRMDCRGGWPQTAHAHYISVATHAALMQKHQATVSNSWVTKCSQRDGSFSYRALKWCVRMDMTDIVMISSDSNFDVEGSKNVAHVVFIPTKPPPSPDTSDKENNFVEINRYFCTAVWIIRYFMPAQWCI